MHDNEEERDADRGENDLWEEGEGIAIRTDTLTIGGELELSSVIETFVEIARDSVPLSGDEAELGFRNILARENKEGGTSAVRLFSSSSPLGAEGFVGVGTGVKTGGERLGVEPEQGTVDRGSA